MIQKNLCERQISNFIETNGIGTIATNCGYRDVFVYGYFTMWQWCFMVHRALDDPRYFTVSEVSTGRQLRDEVYYTIEDALYFARSFIKEKRYYLATTIGDVLVRTQCNLSKRNTNLQTLAIDTALWL